MSQVRQRPPPAGDFLIGAVRALVSREGPGRRDDLHPASAEAHTL